MKFIEELGPFLKMVKVAKSDLLVAIRKEIYKDTIITNDEISRYFNEYNRL